MYVNTYIHTYISRSWWIERAREREREGGRGGRERERESTSQMHAYKQKLSVNCGRVLDIVGLVQRVVPSHGNSRNRHWSPRYNVVNGS